jgi:cell division protein FtsB
MYFNTERMINLDTIKLNEKISNNKERLENMKVKKANLEREIANLEMKILNQEVALKNKVANEAKKKNTEVPSEESTSTGTQLTLGL